MCYYGFMRIAYAWVPGKCAQLRKPLMIALGLTLMPLAVRPDKLALPPRPSKSAVSERPDPRAVRLQRFLARLHSPTASLAPVFVREADENHLDWRLLPSISVVESGAGKICRNNNIFGWNNGNQPFPSVRSGIHEVAYRLGRSSLYRNRDIPGKLRVYNSEDEAYVGKVLAVMNSISPRAALSGS
jgi:hypothetical protein